MQETNNSCLGELTLLEILKRVGGVSVVAVACGLSTRGVYKWTSIGMLPRTEYTGETQYSEIIAALSENKELKFTAQQLRDHLRPQLQAA